MGQGQSVQGSHSSPRSYYDLLDLDRSANDYEIKRAYRKKALELHPDRNLGNVDETTRLFAEVQAAYEVLSDPQERAWYDSHEGAILVDEESIHLSSEVRFTSAEDVAKLVANFRGKNDYTDSPTGFFSTLRNVFDQLAREELSFSDAAGLEPVVYPTFGTSEDKYQLVGKPFYEAWSGFATCKSFAWKDFYKLSDAADRRMRRAMDKENKRLRDEAIKDYNDTVRTLVAFAKKRDSRHKTAKQSEAERQQSLREHGAAQAAKARVANQIRMGEQTVPDWMDTERSKHDADESVWDDAEEEVREHYECVVCEKIFKTEKQYEAHERSKKHLQAVKKIQKQMRREGIDLGLDSSRGDADCDRGQVQSDWFDGGVADEGNVPVVSLQTKYTHVDDKHDTTGGICRETLSSGSESAAAIENDAGSELEDYTSQYVVVERLPSLETLDLEPGSVSDGNDHKMKGKAKQKRARKIAKQSGASPRVLRCITCELQFLSKTQLFKHLKLNPSHAQPPNGARHTSV